MTAGTAAPPTEAPSAAPVTEVTGAAFGYGERAFVEDVTLTIWPGEVVAVLGPNGSGKTTLVTGLLGLNEHLRGTVRLFGQPLDRFTQHSRIGYVPQRHTLSGSVRATVEEIVGVGRLSRRRWWHPAPSRADQTVVARALETVGLADRASADVSTLSGGQHRRVLIARALASEPDILVMDEPTAGVDLGNQQVLADVLARLATRGTTMVIVTHELHALASIVTRSVLVENGHVLYDGPPAQAPPTAQAPHAHHDDEPTPGPRTVPGTPAAGPLDPWGGGRRG